MLACFGDVFSIHRGQLMGILTACASLRTGRRQCTKTRRSKSFLKRRTNFGIQRSDVSELRRRSLRLGSKRSKRSPDKRSAIRESGIRGQESGIRKKPFHRKERKETHRAQKNKRSLDKRSAVREPYPGAKRR